MRIDGIMIILDHQKQHHNYEKQVYNYENEKTQCKAIKEDFTTLFNHFKDIQFNVFTLANFEPNLDNVTVS